jgi:hypothetical protein
MCFHHQQSSKSRVESNAVGLHIIVVQCGVIVPLEVLAPVFLQWEHLSPLLFVLIRDFVITIAE